MENVVKLSVIIPVYNVAAYLPTTIESVLAQSFRDFELLLVDNGSTDGSGDICDRYARSDNRIKVIHQENAGVSVARNTGVEEAKGEYIGFTDSDDIIEKDMYEILISLAQRYDADIVQCQHDRADTLNGAARADAFETLDGAAFVRRIFTKTSGKYTNQVSLCTKIIRKKLFEGIRFPAGQVYEDEQQTYKLCLKANKIVETPDILYHYIKRENSIITGISARKMLDKQLALLDRLNYLPQRLPDLRQRCAAAFLSHSKYILCEMYHMGDMDAVRQAMDLLLENRKQVRSVMSWRDKLYFPWMKRKPDWILGTNFAPVQKLRQRLKGRKK